MKKAARHIQSGIAAAAFRIAVAAPTMALFGPTAAIAAMLTSWLAARRPALAA